MTSVPAGSELLWADRLAEVFVRQRLEGSDSRTQDILAYDRNLADEWETGTSVVRVFLAVLVKAPDLRIFFDLQGRVIGWRDDARVGATIRQELPWADLPPALRKELDAVPDTLKVKPQYLDQIGWTVEAQWDKPRGNELGSVRAWVGPESRKLIQVLHPPEGVANLEAQEAAAETAGLALFARRLRGAGLFPDPLRRYVTVSAAARIAYDGGTQVRLATWRHWSDAVVEIGPQDRAIIGWRIDRLATKSRPPDLENDTVVNWAASLMPVPAESVVEEVGAFESAPGYFVYRVRWKHEVGGIGVAGDRLEALMDPDQERLVGMSQRWRAIVPSEAKVGPAVARDVAAAQRVVLDLDDSLVQGEPWLQYVRIAGLSGFDDRLVWVVPFSDSTGLVELLIDAVTGVLAGTRSQR